MSERRYWETSIERGIREHRKSIEAEPDWTDIEASKTWLEERYPLLDDTSFGSPLFRYIKACVKYPLHTPGRTTKFLASMLSFDEMLRHDLENDVILTFDPFQTKLYPYYGFPEQDRAPEPTWNDKDASRTWLEQRYPLGPHSSGSPLYRYMHACRESRHYICSSTAVLGSMLTGGEWARFYTAYPRSVRPLHLDTSNPIVLYPEYDQGTWPEQGPGERASATPTKILPENPSRKRGNEVLDDKQLASSHYKKMRASPGAGGDESLTSYIPAGTPPVDSSRKNNIGNKEDASQAGSPAKSRQTLSSPGNNEPPTSSPSVEIPLAGPSRKRSIEDVGGAPTTNSSPKRKRTRSTSGGSSTSGGWPIYGLGLNSGSRSTSVGRETSGDSELHPYSPDDPPPPISSPRSDETPNFSDAEGSTSGGSELRPYSPDDLPQPISSPRSDETSTGDRAKGRTPDPASLRQKSPSPEPPEWSPISSPRSDETSTEDRAKGRTPDPASLRQKSPSPEPPEWSPISSPRSDETSTEDRAKGRTPDPASLRQESPSYEPPEPESQGEHHIHVKQESDDIATDSENPRDQTTDHVLENGGDRTVQTAISVVIPMQRLQRQVAANQAPSSDEDNANVPLLQRRGKEGQKPGPKGRKASNSEPQRKQGKRESARSRKNRQSKPESPQSAYVGKLRSGVGERKQRKPRLVILEFEGRKAVQVKAN